MKKLEGIDGVFLRAFLNERFHFDSVRNLDASTENVCELMFDVEDVEQAYLPRVIEDSHEVNVGL